ncbi:MAG: insulinase family protein [Candidatus Riflebacteria bacterium]|nr:insulinase family protein [Candidatus Riflebacteria bacterium]
MTIIKRNYTYWVILSAFILVAGSLFALVKSPPEKVILPNGLRVIVVEDRSLPVAAAGIIFNTHPYYLNNCNAGIGRIYRSLIESADFENETRFDFNARLESVGIINEFGGGQEMFYAACNGNAENLDMMLDSLHSIAFRLKPTDADFAQGKYEAIRYVKSAKRYPKSTGLMEKMMWKDLYHDSAIECHGPISESKLAEAEFADLKNFTSSIFVPNNAVLVVIGDIQATEVFKAAMQKFGDQQAAVISTDVPESPKNPASSRKIENIEYADLEETEVLIGFEAPGISDPDMAAASLWQAALYDINNSWLEYAVRKDFPELKNLFARYVPGREQGLFLIGFSSREADVERPLNFILTSLSNLYMTPPRGNELQSMVEMMQLKTLEKRESRLERVYELGFAELMGNYRISEGISAAFSRVTPPDMKNLAQKMFSSDRFGVRIIYPIKNQKAEDIPVKMQTLDNGARVVVRSFAGSEVVGLSILFGVDLCVGNEEEQKLTRLVAEMVCDYINDHENRKLNAQLDEIGARLEAVFTNESLIISARTRNQKLPELLAFLSQLLQQPEFSEAYFTKAKERILQRLADEKNSINNILYGNMIDGLYPGMNFYSPNLLGSDMNKINFARIKKFYNDWAVGANLCVAAVGNFDNEQTLKLVASAFAALPKGKSAIKATCPIWVGQPLEKIEVREVKLPANSEYAYIGVGFRMKPFLNLSNQEDIRTTFGANSVMSHLLFASNNALILQELKKIDANRGLSGIYRANQLFSIFTFYAAVPVEKLDEARQTIERVVAQIPELKVSHEDIQAAGRKLKSWFNRALERSDAQAATLAGFLWNGLRVDYLEEILGVYGQVTIEDVKQSAGSNFKNYLLLIARPEK